MTLNEKNGFWIYPFSATNENSMSMVVSNPLFGEGEGLDSFLPYSNLISW